MTERPQWKPGICYRLRYTINGEYICIIDKEGTLWVGEHRIADKEELLRVLTMNFPYDGSEEN